MRASMNSIWKSSKGSACRRRPVLALGLNSARGVEVQQSQRGMMSSIAVMTRSRSMSSSRVLLIILMMLGAGIGSISSQQMPAPPETEHAKIMVLGTFHFDDQGLDGYKPKHRLDFLSEA